MYADASVGEVGEATVELELEMALAAVEDETAVETVELESVVVLVPEPSAQDTRPKRPSSNQLHKNTALIFRRMLIPYNNP